MSEDRSLEAFTRIYLAYLPTLRGMVAKMMGDRPDEVEDVLQDVWIRVSRVWLREPIRYPKSYLGRAAITTALMRRRGSWARRQATDVDAEAIIGALPDRAPGPDDLTESRMESDELEAAIRDLSPVDADLLILHLYRGLSFPEVGQAHGRSTGWAKSKIWRSIRLLKERFRTEPAIE
jgi:RNA polymerase sigma-70 factor (ECF subfamily)